MLEWEQLTCSTIVYDVFELAEAVEKKYKPSKDRGSFKSFNVNFFPDEILHITITPIHTSVSLLKSKLCKVELLENFLKPMVIVVNLRGEIGEKNYIHMRNMDFLYGETEVYLFEHIVGP